MLGRLIFLVAVYLGLDVANPMMPGALAFSAEDSVEVRLAHRPGAEDAASTCAVTSERLQSMDDVVVRAPKCVRAAAPRRDYAPRLYLSAKLPPAPAEDH